MNTTQLTLWVATAFIGIPGLLYLFAPQKMMQLPAIQLTVPNGTHAIRAAYGGAFIAFALLFASGASNADLSRTSLIAMTVFMGGFAFGRIVSMIADGLPHILFRAVLAGELLFALIGIALVTQN
ncbi:DUF4345 domain-containing protein [Undibacterium sp. Di27W]|uniref:DUF4345 domain-containing protein n=1 Tax=Undibacterium sp. Di27W TaxID=3413036 RepID=UPI003BF3F044